MRQDEAPQRLIAAARRRGKTGDATVRQKLAELAIACAISKHSGYRAMTDGLQGSLNPHLSAAMKLAGTSLAQAMSTAHLALLGAYGQPSPAAPARSRRTSSRSGFSVCRAPSGLTSFACGSLRAPSR